MITKDLNGLPAGTLLVYDQVDGAVEFKTVGTSWVLLDVQVVSGTPDGTLSFEVRTSDSYNGTTFDWLGVGALPILDSSTTESAPTLDATSRGYWLPVRGANLARVQYSGNTAGSIQVFASPESAGF